MAEDAIDQKKRVYDPKYDAPKTPKFKITRRGLLQGAGVLTAGTALGAIIGPRIMSNPESNTANKTTLEKLIDKGVKPQYVYLGEVEITVGTSTMILNVRSESSTDSEIIDWNNIEKWNGKDLSSNKFLVKNPIYVEGGNPDDPTGSLGKKGLWMVGLAGMNRIGIRSEEPKYISMSGSTSALVKPLDGGELKKIAEVSKKGLVTDKGLLLPDQVGLVSPLPNAPR